MLVKPDGTTAEVPWILDKGGKVSELRPDLHDMGDVEIAGKDRVVFNNVPKGGLFMMTDEENMPIGRPFTYVDRECRRW